VPAHVLIGPARAWAAPHTIALISPAPDFDPGYAMGIDLSQPLVIATLTPAGQRLAPLLIDGNARPVTAL
jgi:hypothetical protein